MRLHPVIAARTAITSALICAVVTPVRAQTVVEADRFVVTESPLEADAAGVSQLRTPDTAPTAVRTLPGVAETVANLHVSASGAGSYGSLVSLRGLVNTPYFSDASVAVYLDDIPLGSTFTYPVDLLGFSTSTIWRGPQPAASGRAAEGGLVVFSSPTPGARAGGTVRTGFGNFGERLATLEFRSVRSARGDASVSASYNQRDGYINNTELGTTVDDQQVTTASARVRLRPIAGFEASVEVLMNRHRDGAQPLVPLGGPLLSVARDRDGTTRSDFIAAALKLGFDTSLGPLTSTTSRTRWQLDPYDDRLVLPPPLDSRLTQTQSAWNEEIRLASAEHALAAWKLGAWFSDVRTEGAVNRSIPGLFPIEGSSFTLRARSLAAFGETTVSAGQNWQLMFAARLEQIDKDFARGETVPVSGSFAATNAVSAVLPKATAMRGYGTDTHLSASIGLGLKPGGWSAYTDKPNLAAFSPEKVVAYEAGLDTALARRTVRLAVRVFDYEIRDYQIERSFNETDYLVVNAPRARSMGGEFEATWRPVTAWTLTATLGVADTTLREFTDPFTGVGYAGHRAPYAPAYDAHVRAAYQAPNGWFASADLTAIGRTFFDESEASAYAAPEHITGNAQLGFDARRWQVSVHVENIADLHYPVLIIPGVGHQVPGSPRTYGVELTAKW